MLNGVIKTEMIDELHSEQMNEYNEDEDEEGEEE